MAALPQGFAPYEVASATLLAQQPPTLPGNDNEPEKADWQTVFNHLETRLGALRNWRLSWWHYWSELGRYILPRRDKYLIVANNQNRGNPINQEIVDGTGTLAMQVCASGMMSGLMSPSRPWFKLDMGLPWLEPDAAAKEWLEDCEERLYTVLAQSNFYGTFAQAFEDTVTFGTAPVIIYEDFEDVIRCYSPCAGEYYLAVGGRLSNDVLYREFTYTVSQIVDFFRLESCPVQVRSLWEEGGAGLEREFVVAHAIEPNFALSPRGAGSKKPLPVVKGKFTFREVYWLKGVKTPAPLSLRGFNDKPFVTLRWSTVSNDAYGRSPGMDALPDIKQLQLETRRKAELIEKFVRPPMGADVQLKNEPASIIPGQVTYMNTQSGEKKFFPLFEVPPTAMSPIVEDLKEIQNRVRSYFKTDVFLMISQMEGVQPRNELEIAERKGEKIQQLGPVIELFEKEADPAIIRVLNIMDRRGLLPPRPPSMLNVPLKIVYVSMMKLAQRASETAAMERGFAVTGSLDQAAIAAGSPPPGRIIDYDSALRTYLEMVAFPAKTVYSEQQVQQQDSTKAAAARQQQAAAGAMQLAKSGGDLGMTAVNAAQGLASTPVGGGQSALEAMLGTGGAPPGPGGPG